MHIRLKTNKFVYLFSRAICLLSVYFIDPHPHSLKPSSSESEFLLPTLVRRGPPRREVPCCWVIKVVDHLQQRMVRFTVTAGCLYHHPFLSTSRTSILFLFPIFFFEKIVD